MLPCWQTLLASASAWFMTSTQSEITPTQRPGKSFLFVPSRDRDGILWLKLLLGCEPSQWEVPGNPNSWLWQETSQRDSCIWNRRATSRCFPVGFWREPPLSLRSYPVFWEIYFESCGSWLQDDFAARQTGLGKSATPSKKAYASPEVSLKVKSHS